MLNPVTNGNNWNWILGENKLELEMFTLKRDFTFFLLHEINLLYYTLMYYIKWFFCKQV